MHIKAEDMTQFDIFHVFVENSVNSELCFFFWAPLKSAKIWNSSKNAHVWAAWKTSSVELKKEVFGLFWIIKAHGPKNKPPFSPGI